MRRISLALALIGAVALTGCGSGKPTSKSADTGTLKGTYGQNFYVNLFAVPIGGIISSADGQINCGSSDIAVVNGAYQYTYYSTASGPSNRCGQFLYDWSATVALTATAQGGNAFGFWAGDCSGSTNPCNLDTSKAGDKTVVAIFGKAGSVGHTSFLDPKTHGPAALAGTTYKCDSCHGATLGGAGIAPSCSTSGCHSKPDAKSGLVAKIVSITPAGTTPTVVQFTLKDSAGKNVDANGAGFVGGSNKNHPIDVKIALVNFATTGGKVGPFLSSTGGNPGSPPSVLPTLTGPATSGTIPAANSTSPSGYYQQGATICTFATPCTCTTASPCTLIGTAGFQAGRACTVANPCTCTNGNPCSPALGSSNGYGTLTFDSGTGNYSFTGSNVYAATASLYPVAGSNLLNNTQTLWLATYRREDLTPNTGVAPLTNASCTSNCTTVGVGVDNGAFYTASIDSYAFTSTNTLVTTATKRQLVDNAGCLKCHDQFQSKSSVAATFHSAARNDGTYCAVCHYPTRGTPAGNAASFSFVHRIHHGEELTRVTSGNVTTGSAISSTNGLMTSCGTGAAACNCTATNVCIPALFDATGAELTYPQDIRNCDQCHMASAAQGGQYLNNPTRGACGSCHDSVSFVSPAPYSWMTVHSGGAQADDSGCLGCHGPGQVADAAQHMTAVLPPDPIATYFWPNQTTGTAGTGWTQNSGATICTDGAPCTCGSATAAQCVKSGTNSNTNAAYIAAAGATPAGANVITYVLNSASLDANRHPVLKFKFQKNGTDVVFQSSASANELMANFVGAPSLYMVYAIAQDGIAAPADFNGSISAYLKDVWKGNLTVTVQKTSGTDATTGWTGKNAAGATVTTNCSGANGPCVCNVRQACSSTGAKVVPGTLTGPDAGGYYTATLTGSVVPAGAGLLYGGVGYSYSLSSTQPLTQIDVGAYPYNATNKTGGITVAPPDAQLAVNPADVRRTIVSNDKCNACHAQLGVGPTFHAGQRNNGETCAWCHKPNQTSNGWSANAATFIHGIHGAEARSTDFLWHATCNYTSPASYQAPNGTCTTDGTNAGTLVAPKTYGPDVTYPGHLENCQQCHVAGSYSFGNAANVAQAGSLLPSTVGAGTYTAAPAQNPAVALATNYGLGFAINNYTGDLVNADGTTLISSAIAAACYSCHDGALSASAKATLSVVDPTVDTVIEHIQSAGGSIYEARSTALAKTENCLECHSAGKLWGIDVVHQ